MSLCIAFQNYNQVLVAVDTAVSTSIENKRYRCTYDCQDKIFVHDGDIYFVSGLLQIKNMIKDYILNQENFELNKIAEFAKLCQDYLKQFKMENICNSEIGILIFTKDGKVYSFCTQNDFAISEFCCEPNHVNPYTFGFKSEEAMQLIDKYYTLNIPPMEIILKVYSDIVCEEIGGDIKIFNLNYIDGSIQELVFTLDESELDINYSNYVPSESISSNHCIFKGSVQAKEYLDAVGNQMFVNNKFQPEYLELKGLNVNNNFLIDENGRVTINGGSISFNSVNGLQSAMNKVQNTANKAYDNVTDLANGEFSGGTFIDGTKIYSPEIYSNHFKVIPENAANIITDPNYDEGFSAYKSFGGGNIGQQFLNIKAVDAITRPQVDFSSPYGAYASWDFGVTYVQGVTQFLGTTYFSDTCDFTGAKVKGLTYTFA